jgi:hypothetical protein
MARQVYRASCRHHAVATHPTLTPLEAAMPSLTCPNCHHDIAVTLVGVPPRGKNPAGVLTGKVMRSVLEFMREQGEGRVVSTAAYDAYISNPKVTSGEWPSITPQALFLALKANGATKWRDAMRRGYEIPALVGDEKPASPPPSVAERTERAAYRETVSSHQLVPGITIDPPRGGLPFEMEGV